MSQACFALEKCNFAQIITHLGIHGPKPVRGSLGPLLVTNLKNLKSSWRLGGFTQKQIEIHKSEYLSIYGHQNLRHLIRLEEIGLIQVQNEKSSRQVKDTMIKTLKLNEKAKDIFKQTNASYVFDSNWSPITTKLVHEAVSGKNIFLSSCYKCRI